jgi:hypothetical protein
MISRSGTCRRAAVCMRRIVKNNPSKGQSRTIASFHLCFSRFGLCVSGLFVLCCVVVFCFVFVLYPSSINEMIRSSLRESFFKNWIFVV